MESIQAGLKKQAMTASCQNCFSWGYFGHVSHPLVLAELGVVSLFFTLKNITRACGICNFTPHCAIPLGFARKKMVLKGDKEVQHLISIRNLLSGGSQSRNHMFWMTTKSACFRAETMGTQAGMAPVFLAREPLGGFSKSFLFLVAIPPFKLAF